MADIRRDNCITYALKLWWRYGGYVVLTQSQYGWWPHAMWSEDLKVFIDFDAIERKRKRRLPPLWYLGRPRVRRLRTPTPAALTAQ